MLRNDQIQAALIAYLKAQTDVTVEIGGSTEIREDQWQGTEFVYPNIRLRLISTIPMDEKCSLQEISFAWMVFSESPSSLESDRIAGIIHTNLHEKSFTSSSIGFNIRTTELIPAFRRDARTWMAQVVMNGTATG